MKTPQKRDMHAHSRAMIEARIAKGRLGGRPKGSQNLATIEKKKVEAAVDQFYLQKAQEIARAQLIPALGQHFIYRIDEERNEKGKVVSREHVLVEDPSEIARALDFIDEGGNDREGVYYYITAKEADWRAAESIFNRIFGKPKEKVDVSVEHSFSLSSLLELRSKLALEAGNDALPVPYSEIEAP